MKTCESGEPASQPGLARLAIYAAIREQRETMMEQGGFEAVGEEHDDLYS